MLDKNSHVPLYLQIEEIITKNIDDGIWKENDKLPPETLLAKKLGVNRITLREGLNSLIKRGILERVRGVGVFVRNPNKKKVYNWKLDTIMTGYHNETINKSNLKTEVLKLEKTDASDYVNKILKTDSEILYLERLRYIEDLPVCIEKSYLEEKFFQNSKIEDFKKSKYDLVKKNGLIIKYIDRAILPIIPSINDRELLKLSQNDVALQVNGTTYLDDLQILEYSETIYNANIFNFTLTVYD